MKTATERLKRRLSKDRKMTTISLRVPQDVIDDLKEIAPTLGFSGYQPLIKTYIGQGLRNDLERFEILQVQALTVSLRKQGISDEVISMAIADAEMRQYTGHVMENPFAIKAENFINSIIRDTNFRARAKNLGIGTPQLELTNGRYATENNVEYEHFFVTLSEQDELLSESEQNNLFLRLLVEGAECLKSEEDKQVFRQLRNIMR